MSFRFVHIADIHLGFRQYGSAERYNDFAAAFEHIVADTIRRRADFVLLAGDLFHKRSIDPHTLLQATVILQRLQKAGIPVVAVQGNHERPHLDETTSWLDYLAEMRLLTLLTMRYREGAIALDEWTSEDLDGAYVDLPCGARVIGLQYFGAAAPRVVRDLGEALAAGQPQGAERAPYTILMLHAGLQGILDGYDATLSRAQLEPLRPHVDYVALGHIHKPFVQDDWIYNPGSPETTGMNEVEWPDRGYLVVDVDAGPGAPSAVRVQHVRNPRRAFVRLRFQVDTYEDPVLLFAALEEFLAREASDVVREGRPVVELDLRGVLAFSRADLDIGRAEALTASAFAACVSRVKDSTVPSEFDIEMSDRLTRAELEKHVLRELLERDARHRERSEDWSAMIVALKQMVLGGATAQEIVNELGEYANTLDGAAAEPEAVPC